MNTKEKPINLSFLNKLRITGIIEGTSTLVLFFVAMPLKYMADFPLLVKIFGPLHGFLFIFLIVMCCIGMIRVPLGILWGIVGIVAAVIPFGPFLVDLHLKKLAKQAQT